MIKKRVITLLSKDIRAKERDLILSATTLFHRYGFSKVSVEEICSRAKVSKVTFYRYYKSKDELILKIISLLFEDIRSRAWQELNSPLSLKEKFDRVAILKKEFTELLGEEIISGLFNYPGVQSYYQNLSRNTFEDFKAFLYSQQEEGNINSGLNIELFLALLEELSSIVSRNKLLKHSKSYLDMVSQINEILISGIFNRDPQ